MKLRALELDQFRKFTRPVRITGIADGLNVLCGPNEMGKSTLMAALCGVLFEKHNSANAVTKSFKNDRNDTAPFVGLDFELEGGRYRIEKTFLKSKAARLYLPDGRRIDNDAAEVELQRLLGFAEAGRSGATADSLGMWHVLWVRQGDSFERPDLAASARTAIQSCLEGEVGALTGGEAGRVLPQAIREARAELLDGRGHPKGRYKEVLAALDEVAGQIRDLESRNRHLAEDLDQLAADQADLARLSDDSEEEADRQALAEARQRLEQATLLKEQIKGAEANAALARNAADLARQKLEARRALAGAIALAEQRLQQAEAARAAAAEQAALTSRDLQDQRQAVAALEAAKTEAAAEPRRLRRLRELLRKQADIQRLGEQLARAEAEQAKARDLSRRAAAVTVTEKLVRDLQGAVRLHDAKQAALQAVATDVALHLLPEAAGRVRLNGAAPSRPDERLKVVADLTIAIDGIGEIAVSPAIADKHALLRDCAEAERRVAALLEEARTASLAEAEQLLAEKTRLLAEVKAAEQAVAILAPGGGGIAPGIEALRAHLDALSAALAVERGGEELPPAAEIDASLGAAESRDEALDTRIKAARAALAGPEQQWQRHQAVQAKAEADAAEARRHLEARIAERDAMATEADLAEAVAQAERGLAQMQAALEALRAQDGGDSLDSLRARVGRLTDKIEGRKKRLQDLTVAIASRRAAIRALEGDGLGEKLDEARRRREQLEREAAYFKREADVLTLLGATLAEAEREAKERYMAPVTNRIRPYLNQLFPGSRIDVTENFEISGVIRQGDSLEEFEQLSDGTKEQIAVLTRLAFAEMLIDRGQPATVILDDALVFSDDRRMERMFDILYAAAQKMQIIVLTCRERLFEELGGTRLTLETDREPVLL